MSAQKDTTLHFCGAAGEDMGITALVTIGTSACSLEEITRFFGSNTASIGLAIVLIEVESVQFFQITIVDAGTHGRVGDA